MIQIILATHGELGQALIDTAGMVNGNTDTCYFVGLHPGEGGENVEASLRCFLDGFNPLDDVLCLTDIPGGTPAKIALTLSLQYPKLQVLSGVSLGMLAETMLCREFMTIDELKSQALMAAKETTKDIKEAFQEALNKE